MTSTDREKAILSLHPVVVGVAVEVWRRLPVRACLDDLIGAGQIGAIHAVDRFDAARGIPLTSYASLRIRGAILDELRSQDYLPRNQRKAWNAEHGKGERQMYSLDAICHSRNDDDKEESFTAFLASEAYQGRHFVEVRTVEQLLVRARRELTAKDMRVIELYYFGDLCMYEIGQSMGVSESRISQRHTRAIQKLREICGC